MGAVYSLARRSDRLDLNAFVRQLERLDGHLVAVGLQIGCLNFRRERVLDLPNEDGRVALVEEANDDIPPLRCSKRSRGFPPVEEVVITRERAALERNVRVTSAFPAFSPCYIPGWSLRDTR